MYISNVTEDYTEIFMIICVILHGKCLKGNSLIGFDTHHYIVYISIIDVLLSSLACCPAIVE